MTPRGWLPVVASAVVSAVVTWLLATALSPAAPKAAPTLSYEQVARIEDRIDGIERRLRDLDLRPAPLSEPAPSVPTLAAAPKSKPHPAPATDAPPETPEAEPRVKNLRLWAKGQALEAEWRHPHPRDEAGIRRLLDSSDPQEQARGVAALVNAIQQDESLRPLLLETAKRTPPLPNTSAIHFEVAKPKGPAWCAKQVTGEPDTFAAGDLATAWASKQQDMGEVTIDLDYERAVRADAVRIHETYNPGAVAKVLAKAPDGSWDLVWEGREPSLAAPWWSEIRLDARRYATTSIRLVLDTNRVSGWNEIDAVELVGDGLRQWAKDARASSSYSD